jgi:beta-barrel assembly-enhancing protease
LNRANQSFEASVFHPALGNEVASGQIVVDGRELHFQSESITLNVPLPRLQVRIGEGADERIYLQDAESPGWEIFTEDFSILDHPFIPQMQNVRERMSNTATRQEVLRRLRLLGYVAGVLVILVWLVNLGLAAMVNVLVGRVPPKLEQQLGREALKELQETMPFLDDSNRVARVVALAAPLTNAVALGTNGLTFYIAEEEDPNAFALPGGQVVVTTGLLQMVERPEELLGVVAHELAHVKLKHGIRSVISGAGPFLMFGVLLGGQGGLVGMLGGTADLVARSGFSQEYETEADDMGWQIMLAAKVDPRGMTDAFRKLQAREKQQKLHDDMPAAFSTHPAIEKRIARLEKKWQMLKTKNDFLDLSALDSSLRAAAAK